MVLATVNNISEFVVFLSKVIQMNMKEVKVITSEVLAPDIFPCKVLDRSHFSGFRRDGDLTLVLDFTYEEVR